MSSKRRGTAILGIKWQDENGAKILLAADSQVMLGNTRYISQDEQCKLVVFPHFIVGTGGVGPMGEVLLKMAMQSKFKKSKLTTIIAAQAFAKEAFVAFNKLVGDALDSIDTKETDCLMIATKNKLYQVTTDASVTSIDNLASSGCGGDFALGAAMVLYQQLNPGKVTWNHLEVIAKKAIGAACLLSEGCGEPVRIARIT